MRVRFLFNSLTFAKRNGNGCLPFVGQILTRLLANGDENWHDFLFSHTNGVHLASQPAKVSFIFVSSIYLIKPSL